MQGAGSSDEGALAIERLPGPLRIVHVLDNLGVGGSELNAFRTARELDPARFDLRVVSFNVRGPLLEQFREHGVPVLHYPIGSLYGSGMIAEGTRFVKYLRRERIHLVHAHDMYSNVFAVPWAKLSRTPVVASRRWWYSLPNRKLRVANTIAFRMADAVLANSPQVAESVRRADGVKPARVRVISNFADDAAFRTISEEARQELRRELGVGPAELVIGCVARLVPVKDHATLLRAFAAVRAADRRAKLVLVGDGESHAPLTSLARELGVGDAVAFAGQRLDGMKCHQAFDVSVLASRSEGFPNTLVEAMAAGRPVVATAVGGSVDAVVDGETGLLVPAGDVAALAAALIKLLESAELRHTMGGAAQRRASERYSARTVIASLESFYDDVLARRTA